MNDDAFSVEIRELATNFANQLDGKPSLVAFILIEPDHAKAVSSSQLLADII
jgi:hypothetical protein